MYKVKNAYPIVGFASFPPTGKIAGFASDTLDQSYKGFLFETFMVNQIRGYNEYSKKHLGIYFYGITGANKQLVGD